MNHAGNSPKATKAYEYVLPATGIIAASSA